MKSKKNEELNFLYLDDKYNNITKKKKTSQAQKTQRNKKTKAKAKKEEKNEVFNFDDEIVIGVTQIPKEPEKKKSAKLKQKSKKQASVKTLKSEKKNGAEKKSAPKKIQQQVYKKNIKNTKSGIVKNIIKWTILLSALVASFIFFMMSPLFNVVEIEVTGNGAISKETIISLSEIRIGDNIYKTSKEKIKQKIKQNAYIESVEVKRNLPNKIDLEVKERNTTYMLEYANSFVYINNQGYILEITSQSLEVPIIMGYTTEQEELQVGNRLNKEDLNRLEMVLKIIESTEANGIVSKIDRINIANKQNYTLHMPEEKKIIYLGNASKLSSRMLYLKAALEDTKGLEGEIFVNGDLVKEKAFFRQKQ